MWTLRVRVSPLTFTFTHAHAGSLSPPSPSPSPPVLYNATIDSRPLFHARDLLQSLQPVSGDSVQCPVSLPVSVRKIYFPMRYTGWLGENSSRSISSIPSPSILLPRRHLTSRLSDGHARKQCFSTEFVILCAFVYASRKTSSKRECRIVDRGIRVDWVGANEPFAYVPAAGERASSSWIWSGTYTEIGRSFRIESRGSVAATLEDGNADGSGETGSRPCTLGITSLPINCDRVAFCRCFLDLDPGLLSINEQQKKEINLQTVRFGEDSRFFEGADPQPVWTPVKLEWKTAIRRNCVKGNRITRGKIRRLGKGEGRNYLSYGHDLRVPRTGDSCLPEESMGITWFCSSNALPFCFSALVLWLIDFRFLL